MGSQVVTAIGDRTMTTMIVEIMVAQLPMGGEQNVRLISRQNAERYAQPL